MKILASESIIRLMPQICIRKCINQAYTILIPNPQKEVVYGVIISDDVRIMFHRDAAPS
jgi:hypothetical protein